MIQEQLFKLAVKAAKGKKLDVSSRSIDGFYTITFARGGKVLAEETQRIVNEEGIDLSVVEERLIMKVSHL